ncbi:DUF234 domain-containing protein [Campylobacter sp. CLAX-7218-21]|uniref:DUF234 domain-containing protein n=1 Tax=Campylobacter devanensis TaxID=3161138 RepID=UPI001EF0ED57|nr:MULTISPECIES: DUF234 domain-containing protein [unclassified Campylobacter]MEE3712127.1 DUF234 domain-containing protein [Campylobacter sp. CLAX-7218-21]
MDTLKYLQFYFVFDRILDGYDDIFEAIDGEILAKFDSFCSEFSFYHDEAKIFLMRLAKGDRKRFVASKYLPRALSLAIISELNAKGFIKFEYSKEVKPVKNRHQKLKKELRRYQIQDKIHFTKRFYRFWFRFIEPNLELLKAGDKESVMDKIKVEFDHYCSLEFELASIELLSKNLNIPKEQISSYWDKENEIDIYTSYDGFTLVAEAKYKERKICKNILNLLMQKCEKSKINWDKMALFSKSGFSNELLGLRDNRVILFGLDDFKDLYE